MPDGGRETQGSGGLPCRDIDADLRATIYEKTRPNGRNGEWRRARVDSVEKVRRGGPKALEVQEVCKKVYDDICFIG